MNAILQSHLRQALELTRDLVVHLDDAALKLDLCQLPSNRIADQLWCIVGARESYFRAIASGAWAGFSCSLNPRPDRTNVLAALDASSAQLSTLQLGGMSEAQVGLVMALLEHEVQHHGQLIRYVYANRLTFPASWSKRYTV